MNIDELSFPFEPDRISWRVGATYNKGEKKMGLALAYIDARDVMERLDDVCGPENWQNRYSHAQEKTVCEIGIKIDGEWIWKSDGAGDTDLEGSKGALSDAFKRAAVRWGVGRYLYGMDTPHVELIQRGKSWAIPPDVMADLWKRVGLQSSYELKKDGTWQEFMAGLEKQETLLDLHRYEEQCRRYALRKSWNLAFWRSMREEIQKSEDAIKGAAKSLGQENQPNILMAG